MSPKQKSRPKGIAPANRTYKAVEPLHQTTFPEQKKRITRNYGKKSKLKLENQDTLTQMDWVKLHEREELEKQMEDDIEDSEGDYVEEESKRRTKRRRTMGDEPEAKKKEASRNRRKTLGEEERKPSFSTQTITQLDYWPLSGARGPEQPDDDPSIYDVPVSSSPAFPPPRRSLRKLSKSTASDPAQLMPPPQTPRSRKILEIPSSQSPATPTSSQFGSSTRKRSPLKEQSTNVIVPFSLRSNPITTAEKIPKLKIEDTYETETDESQVLRTPSKHSSPPKTVRFAIPDPSQESSAEETHIKEEHSTQRDLSPSPTRWLGTPAPKNMKFEILDSDAEDEEDEESQVVADTPLEITSGYEGLANSRDTFENTVTKPQQDDEHSVDDTIRQAEGDVEQESEVAETFYGDIGAETQFQAERIMSSSSLSDVQGNTPLSDDAAGSVSYGSSQLPQTQYATTQHTQTQYSQTHRPGTQYTQKQTQFGKSQYPESQRLSTQHLDAMAPRSDSSDVFVSIYPAHMENIISRDKNHEFRSYSFPATVSRIWMYQTRPLSTLTHMAVIGSPKTPGEITNLDGLGNSEFNKGEKRSKFAYEILELYALANPMTLEDLKSRQWFKAAPQKYVKVPPAVLVELIANLLPPLFTQSSSVGNIHSPSILYRRSSTSTESQEVQDQITNNIQQFSHTQVPSSSPPSSPPISTQTPVIHVPSSQHQSVRLSQASTVDYTQTQTPVTPRHVRNERRETPIPEVIPESPAKSIPSSSRGSSPVHILTPVVSKRGDRRVIEVGSQSDDEDNLEEDSLPVMVTRRESVVFEVESKNKDEYDENKKKEDSHDTEDEENEVNHVSENDPIAGSEQESHHPSSTPAPYSLIRSSQLMSRSQMMREQDSLMDREIVGPPPPPSDVAAYLTWQSKRDRQSGCGPWPSDSDDDDL